MQMNDSENGNGVGDSGEEKQGEEQFNEMIIDGNNDDKHLSASEREQVAFENCENHFLPLLHRWRKANDEKLNDDILAVFDRLLENVSSLSAPFMESYDISKLLKRSKQILENHVKCKELKTKLREAYLRKKALVPENFKPKLQNEVVERNGDASLENSERNNLGFQQQEQQRKDSSRSPLVNPKTNVRLISEPKPNTPLIAKIVRKKTLSPRSLTNPVAKDSKATKEERIAGIVPGENVQIAATKRSEEWYKPTFTEEETLHENTDQGRVFATEFLVQAVGLFLAENFSKISVATAIENAIHTFFGHDNAKYWDKIHTISAAICGKSKIGTIVPLIVGGHFKTPDMLVLSRDEVLHKSFEGESM